MANLATRLLLTLLLLAMVVVGVLPPGVAAQGVDQIASADGPATIARAVRTDLIDAQTALLLMQTDQATAAVNSAGRSAAGIVPLLTADATAGPELLTALAGARQAVATNDQPGLAIARGQAWTAMLRGAYAETIAAAGRGDAAAADQWLLLREYRQTTKLWQPSTAATRAVRQLADGEITPDQAVQAISADLLDTYQGRLNATLDDASVANQQAYTLSQAEAVGLAGGYWRLLAPSLETQQGVATRQSADALFASLASVTLAPATGDFPALIAQSVGLAEGFRAVPLTAEEQTSRAQQLLLYLSLVPVEYSRGVNGTTVKTLLEIQEAQAFLDAGRSAFADLRGDLAIRSPDIANAVSAELIALDQQLRSAAAGTAVSTTGEIETSINQVEDSLRGIYPAEWLQSSGQADFEVIRSILDQLQTAVAAGQYQQAESARIQAYAIYEAGPEKHLLGFAPNVAQTAEQLFWQGTGGTTGLAILIQDEAPAASFQTTRLALDDALAEGELRLGTGKPADAAIVFNAATIVFREGLEAVLILAALLASMIGVNRKFRRPLVLGGLFAFVATGALFVVAGSLLQNLSAYGEKLEAIVSVVAIAVLLLVMNWFFHKVYWTKWIQTHQQRRRVLIGGAAGQALGLVMLGFTSIFREGAETVLFLQALVLDAGTLIVLEGVALGLAATAVVGVLVFVLQAKLPHKKMLTVTGVMIAAVLVTMTGNTIHVLQVVGWLPIDPVDGLTLPYSLGVWAGIYATWQGLVAQALALVFVIGSYFAAEWSKERSWRRKIDAQQRQTQQVAPSAGD